MDLENLYFYKVTHGADSRIIESEKFLLKDYNNFLIDKKNINSLQQSFNYYSAYDLNLKDLLRIIIDYGIYLHDNPGNEISNEMILNISRNILNLLAMFRAFIDFSNKSISNGYGKKSTEYEQWIQIQSQMYDNNFEYRFLYKLRNFTQHVGFPPIEVTYTSSIEQKGLTLGVKLQKEVLLEFKDIWTSKIYDELKCLKEDIMLIQTLQSFDLLIKELYFKLIDIQMPKAINSSKNILLLREELKIENEFFLYYGNLKKATNGAEVKLSSIPEDEAIAIINSIKEA